MKQQRLEPQAATANMGTMHDVERVIDEHRQAFSAHAFLRALEGPATLEQFKRFAPRVASFVLTFQDVLRLVHTLSSDPAIKAIARTHALEDKGHDLWYLSDIERLGAVVDVRFLYSDAHRLTRDIAYQQVSLVMSAKHDQTRLAVALSLEAVGAECFGRAIALLERLGNAVGLEYFARKHQAIEQGHQVFDSEAQGQLGHIVVPEEARPEVLAGVDSTFDGMTKLLTDLEHAFSTVG